MTGRMAEKKPLNIVLLAAAGGLAFLGLVLSLYGLYNWIQSFGVSDRFSGYGSLGRIVAAKLQTNYRIKGTIGLVLGFGLLAGAGGAGFFGLKGAKSGAAAGTAPGGASGGPPAQPAFAAPQAPQAYGAPQAPQAYGAPQAPQAPQAYGGPLQPGGSPPPWGPGLRLDGADGADRGGVRPRDTGPRVVWGSQPLGPGVALSPPGLDGPGGAIRVRISSPKISRLSLLLRRCVRSAWVTSTKRFSSPSASRVRCATFSRRVARSSSSASA